MSEAEPSGLPDFSELPERLAGRVIAVDPAGRVLLFRYEDPPPSGPHWATPGGGLEPGEDFYAAARRELAEETGWADVPVRPAEVHRLTIPLWSGGRLVSQHERYFAGFVAVERRALGEEVAAMHVSDEILQARWWTLDELDAADEAIRPDGLAALVRKLLAGG